MQHTTPPMEGSFALPLHNGSNEGAVKQMKDPSAASGKSVVVLKGSDVRIRHGKVFMPNTIEMAQLKKPEKGQFKTNVQFSSTMTEMDVRKLLEGIFPFLRNQRLYCAAAVDNRTRLHFHGQPRVWTGYFLRRKIKGNSALYIVTDEGEIEALQVAQNSSSSDTGFFDQEVDYISSSAFSEAAEPESSSVPHVAPEHMTLFGVVDDIHPKSGSLEGGYKCQINLTEPLESNITSGTAQFKGVDDNVPWQKLNPFTLVLSVPPSIKAGNVDVEVFDQTGKRLGMTVFCYRDFQWEMVKQMISNKNLGSLFSILAQKFESSQLGGGDNAAQGIGPLNMQDQGQTQQQQSLQLLQLLVYTAAETDAQEFIKVIFSTSAGPIVFNSYKDKTPLPEDVARANGHRYLTQYLQDVHTRLSKKVGSEVQSDAIDWLELVKAVQTQASAAQDKSIKEEKHPSKSDGNLSDYFADSETSSRGSSDLDDSSRSDSDSDSPIEDEKLFRPTQSLSSVDPNDFIGLKKEFEVRGSRVPCGSGERFTIHDGCGKWSHIMDVENGPMLKDQQVIDGNSSKDDDQEMSTMSSEAFSIMSEAKDDDATKQYLTASIKRTPVCLLTGVPGLGKRSSLVTLEELFRVEVLSATFTVFESNLRDLRKNVVNFKDKDPETGLPTMAQKKQAILWGSYLVLPERILTDGEKKFEEVGSHITCGYGKTGCGRWHMAYDLFWNPQYIDGNSSEEDDLETSNVEIETQESPKLSCYDAGYQEGVDIDCQEDEKLFGPTPSLSSVDRNPFFVLKKEFKESYGIAFVNALADKSSKEDGQETSNAFSVLTEAKHDSTKIRQINTGESKLVNSVSIRQEEKVADPFLQPIIDLRQPFEGSPAQCCKRSLFVMVIGTEGFGFAVRFPFLVHVTPGQGEDANCVVGNTGSGKSSLNRYHLGIRFPDSVSLNRYHLGIRFPDSVCSPAFTVCELKCRDQHDSVVHFKEKDPETGLPRKAQKKKQVLVTVKSTTKLMMIMM